MSDNERLREDDESEQTDLIQSTGQQNQCQRCFDSIHCLMLALAVGIILLVSEAVLITLVLVIPAQTGLSRHFLTFYQRVFLGGASILMLLEAVVFTAVDIWKGKTDTKKRKKRELESYYYLKYATTLFFDTAMYMGVWAIIILNIKSTWLSVSVVVVSALLRAPLKYWQTLIDPYAK